jgi:hypothetical protein
VARRRGGNKNDKNLFYKKSILILRSELPEKPRDYLHLSCQKIINRQQILMKNKLTSIIGNGSPYGFLFFALSFIMGYYSADLGLRKTLIIALSISVPAVLINGILYSRFTKPVKKLEQITIELNDAEALIHQAPANFIVDDGLIPGKLFLTHERLIFKSFSVDGETALEYFWNKQGLTIDKLFTTYRNAGGQFRVRERDSLLMFEVDDLRVWSVVFE